MHHLIIGELPHLTVGAVVFYLVYVRTSGLQHVAVRTRLLLLSMGAFTGITPDISKLLLGDLWAHTIWCSPVLATFIALYYHKQFRFWRIWAAATCTILMGHLGLDLLDNGVALLYPIIPTEFELALLAKQDMAIPVALVACMAIGFMPRVSFKTCIVFGLLICVAYVGYKAVVKVQIEEQLRLAYGHYSEKRPTTIIPSSDFTKPFTYSIMSRHFRMYGHSTFTAKLIEEHKMFNTHWQVVNEYEHDGVLYIECVGSGKNNSDVRAVFRSTDYEQWDRVEDGTLRR
ncbi:hypothetical protein [Paenibacillus sp. YYML68]|uniref:hypothetical protein n=1 Tax=Paenibacillus sp. YYML68 TaxID=2909250 RepID=UPI002490F179|nr:hypothetical protein [Paenibacillus sp. YYML68]